MSYDVQINTEESAMSHLKYCFSKHSTGKRFRLPLMYYVMLLNVRVYCVLLLCVLVVVSSSVLCVLVYCCSVYCCFLVVSSSLPQLTISINGSGFNQPLHCWRENDFCKSNKLPSFKAFKHSRTQSGTNKSNHISGRIW